MATIERSVHLFRMSSEINETVDLDLRGTIKIDQLFES